MLAVLGFVTILLVLALIMSKKVSTLVALNPCSSDLCSRHHRLHRGIHQCPQCHHPSRTGCCRKGRNCLC